MRRSHPFLPEDLESLDEVLSSADAVVSMVEIATGDRRSKVIGMRHDVDDNKGSFQAALKMARWEADRGYRSTYFLLHSASYWKPENLRSGIAHFEGLGHEVGIHVNALAESIRTGRDSHEILRRALLELRAMGANVVGSVAHGDELCRSFHFVNDEIFTECQRPGYGGPRVLGPAAHGLRLEPRPRSEYGLMYDSIWLPRRFYASDSGGVWSKPWEEVELEAVSEEGQLHMLIHPDWWTQAFA